MDEKELRAELDAIHRQLQGADQGLAVLALYNLVERIFGEMARLREENETLKQEAQAGNGDCAPGDQPKQAGRNRKRHEKYRARTVDHFLRRRLRWFGASARNVVTQ